MGHFPQPTFSMSPSCLMISSTLDTKFLQSPHRGFDLTEDLAEATATNATTAIRARNFIF